jgi:hypothetical protein
MKKIIMAFVVLLLLAGASAFAADGDLVVNGKLGVGTTTPASKLTVVGTIESTTGGVKFPDGTVLTSAASGVTAVWHAPIVKTSGTSYTTPAGCKTIRVTVVGGGGNGGTSYNDSSLGGGGGGGGGYAQKLFTVTGGTTYTYAVGAAGGNSTFTVGATTITGNKGNNGINGTATAGTGGAGGTGVNGDINLSGGAGQSRSAGIGGVGGASGRGMGAGGAASISSAGGAGALFGGGGAGGSGNSGSAGGAGAAGVVIIEEYY